jgi:hypothetical protein
VPIQTSSYEPGGWLPFETVRRLRELNPKPKPCIISDAAHPFQRMSLFQTLYQSYTSFLHRIFMQVRPLLRPAKEKTQYPRRLGTTVLTQHRLPPFNEICSRVGQASHNTGPIRSSAVPPALRLDGLHVSPQFPPQITFTIKYMLLFDFQMTIVYNVPDERPPGNTCHSETQARHLMKRSTASQPPPWPSRPSIQCVPWSR